MKEPGFVAKNGSNRRAFLKNGVLAAGAAAVSGAVLTGGLSAFGRERASDRDGDDLTKGDVAILRFLAAAELIEADLWIQYAELGGIGNNPPIEVDPNQTRQSP